LIKKIQFVTVLILYFSLSFTALTAKEISGTLSRGEVSSFLPLQGSAFSIVSDVTCGIYDGTYDVIIKNNYKTFYESKNETNNLYLIFNEPVDSGDKIEIKVHRGVFIFKMSKMEKLPEAIIDALKEQVPEQYEKMESLHKPRVSTPVEEKVIIQPKPIVEKEVISVLKPKIIEPGVKEIEVIKPIVPEFKEEKNEGFLATLTRKIDALFSAKEPEDVVLKTSPPPTFSDVKIEKEIVKPTPLQRGISNLPQGIIIKEAIVNKTVIPPNISEKAEELTKFSKTDTPKTSLPDIKTSPTFSPVLNQKNSADMAKIGLPEKKNDIESFQKSSFPKSTQMQTGKFKTEISTAPVQTPSFKDNSGEFGVREIKKIDDVPVFKNEVIKVSQVTKVVPVATVLKPREVNKPIIEEGETNDKIIITKTIAPKDEPRVIKRHVEPSEYKKSQNQSTNLDKMSDRVLGGGYGQEAKATFAVKAYSNKKPVSAWVEVFKAGTNQRIKTFYTGSGRGLKDIKLPAGVYVVKATYRTAASKQKKTLGKIRLKEGQNIKRSISFDDGSIIVTVKKLNKPFYAKVEVFKSGSKRRVAYDFTSRKNGEVEISLASGTYDIIVKNYADERRLNDVVIKGSQTQMLNVNF